VWGGRAQLRCCPRLVEGDPAPKKRAATSHACGGAGRSDTPSACLSRIRETQKWKSALMTKRIGGRRPEGGKRKELRSRGRGRGWTFIYSAARKKEGLGLVRDN